ncbi:CDP-glycerol glycerophosphotransferase family protein [Microbacterium sp. C7(2022)]|uniref:CDP-glycerol glycerophosphotransferase family protein n=1 Tax=Microbacterium sp. C7(2022) TaxID=2992759 RepID=UPI00237A2B40|nr:CDP-glycerol glycerophosphotransferase family protein [Microbacterium sp. C7(2022)]MDE0547322.1 CDP-glycerol glycerophosphotransferase family protein [Microbacterium sp. C7(2022)]
MSASHMLREFLRRSRVLRALRFLPYAIPYRLWSLLLPVRRDRFLFLSDSHDGYSGNFRFLRTELLRQMPHADVRGIFKPSLRAPRRVRDMVRLPHLLATSGTIILDDFYPLIYPLRIRKKSRLVQVWHAAGAFKQVGHSRSGLPGGPTPSSNIHRNYTDAVVSAESIRADYAEAFGIDVANVRALGVPRTDSFFDTGHADRVRTRVRSELGIGPGQRLVLFAPTFRGNGQLSASVDQSADWARIADELGDDYRVVIRMHPFTAKSAPPLPSNVLSGSEPDMNDLLMAADVLITDYSSSIFEFALLRRPIVFFVPDLEEYTAARSFYREFDHYAVGPVVQNEAELATAIQTAAVDDDRLNGFLDEFCGALDGRSSERIVRELFLTPPRPSRSARLTTSVAPGGPDPAPTQASGAMVLRLVAAHTARTALRLVYAPLKLLPQRRKVVMISREHRDVPADFIDLRAAIKRADEAVEVVILVRMVPPGLVGKIGYAAHLLRQLYEVATAQVLIVDTYSMVASMLTHKPSLSVIQMWHALGAFKKFGMSILGQQEGRDRRLARAMRMHEGYDLVLASGPSAQAPFAEALNTDVSRVVVAPLPRVDRLRDRAARGSIRERFFEEYPHLEGTRIALFAPTFRLDGRVAISAEDLHSALADQGIVTLVKVHPLMSSTFGQAVLTAPGYSTQDLMHVADMFITDYSSALFEAAVVGLDTYFLAPDLEEYLAHRDLYVNYRADLPGPVVESIEELASHITAAHSASEQVRRFAEQWVATPDDDQSSAPCADHIAALVIARLTR